MAQLQKNKEEIAPLRLPKLYWPADLLRMSITQEAVKAARLYQEVIGYTVEPAAQTDEELLSIASAHYKRRPNTDWFTGSEEYPIV